MKFGEVIEALEKGLPIRRALWEEDIYTCYNADNCMFWSVLTDWVEFRIVCGDFGA